MRKDIQIHQIENIKNQKSLKDTSIILLLILKNNLYIRT